MFLLPLIELGPLMGALVAIGLLLLLYEISQALQASLNISFFGVRPFGSIAGAIESHLTSWLHQAVLDKQQVARDLWHGLNDSLSGFLDGVNIFATNVEAAFKDLWDTSIPNAIDARLSTTKTGLQTHVTTYNSFVKTTNTAIAKNAADVATINRTLPTTIAVAVTPAVEAAKATLSQQIAGAERRANVYADNAVTTLKVAEGAAVSNALKVANAAQDAGIKAASDAKAAAEQFAKEGISAAEADAASALAAADAAGKTALAAVKSVAVGAADDVHTIEAGLGALGVAGLIASIPALATLVHAIATEAGLEDAACRGKVKQVCGTDPLKWENLLLGLAAVGFGFNLGEIVEAAAHGIGDARGLLAEVSNVPQDAIQRAGQAIGDVTRALAA